MGDTIADARREQTKSASRSNQKQSGATQSGPASSEQSNSETRAPEMSKQPRMDRIAQRAYEIYQARGGEHGKSLDDWLQAEREIDAEIDGEQQ
jgi:hypothetical protein